MELDAEVIKREKAEILARYGKWTAHNIHLAGDAYTIDDGLTGDEFRLRRVMQIIDDMAGSRRLQDMRVLDLACLEGMYSVELARKGATVVAIEGREANIAKAAFAKRVLRLDEIELIQDDVAKSLSGATRRVRHRPHEGISLQQPRARWVHHCVPVPHSARDHLRVPGAHYRRARLVDVFWRSRAVGRSSFQLP